MEKKKGGGFHLPPSMFQAFTNFTHEMKNALSGMQAPDGTDPL